MRKLIALAIATLCVFAAVAFAAAASAASPVLSTSNITSTSVQLNWTDMSDEVSYTPRMTAPTSVTLATLPANTLTFTATGLSPSTQYSFIVYGNKSHGAPYISNTVTVTTLSGGPTTTTTPPTTTTQPPTTTPPPTTTTPPPTTTTPPPTTTTPPPTTTTPPPTCVGTNVSPGAALKAAVDVAPAGTTFCLASGVYTISATTTLQDGDKLIGAGPAATSIEGNGTVQNMFDGASGGTFEVRNLSVSGAVGDVNATCSPDCGRAFIGDGDKWTFDNIRCHDNQNQCLGSGAADVYFLNSECDHNGNAAFAAATNRSTSCIKRVRGGTSNIITEVRNSYIHDNVWTGVWFDFYEGVAILDGNTLVNNGKSGIQYEVSGGFNARDNVTVTGNTITGNGLTGISTIGAGIICNTCADLLVDDNDFGNNFQHLALKFLTTTREWGDIHNVVVTNNRLHGDAVACSTSGVTCSNNT